MCRNYADLLSEHKTSLVLGVDASDAIYKMGGDDEVYLRVPTPKLKSFAAAFNYKTPFSPLRWIYSPRQDQTNPEEDQDGLDTDKLVEDVIEDTQLELHAGVGGKLNKLKQMVTYTDPETGTEEQQEVDISLSLIVSPLSNLDRYRYKLFCWGTIFPSGPIYDTRLASPSVAPAA